MAWDVLSPVDHQAILAKFPNNSHITDAGTETARPNVSSLRNDDTFRYDCARYCENIQLGRHDEEWLRQAWEAHEKQKRGDYDEFLREKFEEQWGIKLPEPEAEPEPEAKAEPEDSGVAGGTENVGQSNTGGVSDNVENTSSVAGDDLPKSLEAGPRKPYEAPQPNNEEVSADDPLLTSTGPPGSAGKACPPPVTGNITDTTNNNPDNINRSDNQGTSKGKTKVKLKFTSTSPSENPSPEEPAPSDSITCATNSLPAPQGQTPTISAGKTQSD